MSIKHAILGVLSYKPSTGYELKKIFEESSFMYWSGNNNQIYKALVELLDEDLVSNEVQHQTGSPSRKIYTITEEGAAELKEWVLSIPDVPEFKKTFLVQLAWADQLNIDEIDLLLSRYENEIMMKLFMEQEKIRRGIFSPDRSARERYIWEMIGDNIISSYRNELSWILKLRQELTEDIKTEVNKMNYRVIEYNNKNLVECLSVPRALSTEQDALDLIAVCGENDTNLLILHAAVLSDDFFKLRTGIAGQMLQKFINYHVTVAAVIPEEIAIKGSLKKMLSESNKGRHFRTFSSSNDAQDWLFSL